MSRAGAVYALMVLDANLIAGGNFTSAGGVSANRIAGWNGSAWFAPLPRGFNSAVDDLTVFNGGPIAAGQFTSPASYVAR